MDVYPKKPELVEQEVRTNWGLTVFSLLMFIFIFMMLFSNEIDLIIGVVIALFIRELGHFLAMRLYKYEKIRVLFIPLMGAFVHGQKKNYSQKESLMIVLFGFLPGLVVGFMLILFSQNINSVACFQMGMLFFLLNIVNLVPLDPLDGGQLFKLIVLKTHEKWMLYLTLFFSVLIIFIGFYFSSYVMTLFGFLMGFRVHSLQKTYYIHRNFNSESIPFRTTYKELSDKHFWQLKEIILENRPSLREYIQRVQASEQDMLLATQINACLVTPVKEDTSIFTIIFIVLVWLLSLVSPILLWWSLDMNWVHYVVKQIQFLS